jgi:hypothetical protein
LPDGEVQFVGTLSDEDEDASSATKTARTTQSKTPAPRWVDSMSKTDQEHAEELMARAMHRTAERFSIFDNPLWRGFFKFLRPSFRIPGRETLGGRLLDAEYLSVQSDVILAIKEFTTICMTLDGATNKCGKQILNMMGAGPVAYFLEHFQMDLKRESADNLLTKLLTSRSGLLVALGRAESDGAGGFIEPIVEPKDYIYQAMFNLCTDSPRVMESLRRKALSTLLFTFAFGCAPHGLNNLTMDWVKIACIKTVVSRNVFIVVKINKVHLLLSMFDIVCAQKLGKSYSLILFTKTRWGTVYANQRRNLLVKTVLTSMPHMIEHEDEYKDVTMEDDLKEAILDSSHWRKTSSLEVLLKPLCLAIAYCEGDEAIFSSVYAVFLSLWKFWWVKNLVPSRTCANACSTTSWQGSSPSTLQRTP